MQFGKWFCRIWVRRGLPGLLTLLALTAAPGARAESCVPNFDLTDQASEWVEVDDGRIGHEVYVFPALHGNGPPVLLLHELPGLSPKTLLYAQQLSQDFTVYVPLLFGSPNQHSDFLGTPAFLFNGEWRELEGLGGSRGIAHWLFAVVERIRQRQPGQPIGAVGMGLTGTLPLALLRDPDVKAAVVAQPTLPFIGDEDDLGISEGEWAAAKTRIAAGDAKVMGIRFLHDRLAPRARHLRLKRELGDAGFIDREIAAEEYAAGGVSPIRQDAHSSLIEEWCPGLPAEHPAERRRADVRRFLVEQLGKPR